MADNPIHYQDLFDQLGPGRQELDDFTKSVGALNRSYKALSKLLDADGQRIAAGLAGIAASNKTLAEQVKGLNVANEQERETLAGLSAELGKMAREQEAYKKAQQGQAEIRRQVADATKQAGTELKKLQTELKQAFTAKDSERVIKAAQAVQQYKRDTDQLNKAIRGANSELTAAAGSYNRLSIETQQLGEKIRALPGGFEATSAEANKLKKEFADNTQKLKDFDREMNQNFREVGAYAKGILEATRALNSQKVALTSEVQALKMQANAAHLSADEHRKLRAEIERTETELQKVTGELRSYGVAASKSGKDSQSLGANAAGMANGFLGAYLGVTALAGAVAATFEKVAEYSDQLASVRKTTNLSKEATDQLAESLKKVDTRTSLSGLLDIAKVGGQLGKAGSEIEGFTKAIDVAVQALEDDFQGGAEQIATELGKIGLVFRKTLGPDQNQNLLAIGSAINQLGADGAATAPFLADVALRVGATAANSRLGLKDVLAYAAVLQETGSSAEVSGTALNRLFNTLSTKTKESFAIAKLADSNLTLKEFKRLVNNDFQGAINIFLKGLNAGGDTTTEFNALLKTLKLQSGEAKNAITTLAKNTDLFAERQATANEQLKTATSLAAEAAIKNDNLAGSWAKLKNDINNFFSSGAGADSLKWLVDATRASLNFKDGFGALFDGRLFGLAKKQVDDYGKSLADSALSQRKFADGTDSLLARFSRLNEVTKPTIKDQQELRETVLQLKDRLGETAVVLNQQTGQYDLNTVAVGRNTKAARAKYLEDATALAKRLEGLDKEAGLSRATATAIQEEATAREKLVRAATGLKSADFEKVLPQQIRQREATPKLYDSSEGAISPLVLQQYKEYVQLTDQAQLSANKAARAEGARNKVLAQLKRLGYDAATAYTLLAQATDDATEKVDESIEKDKQKKQAVADLVKEENALRKQRIEGRIADLDRQAGNPANSEALRTTALQKGKEERIKLAALEREELIHEAAKTYKDQLGGAQALEVARVRLTEQFSAKKLEIERSTDKQVLALHNTLLDQLTAVDKLVINSEIDALESLAQDENRSAQERQQALLDAAARRIEIVELEAASKIRAAKGDAAAEKLIYEELAQQKATILARPRANNSDFTNSELNKQYVLEQTALERKLASGLLSEKDYRKQLKQLDDDYAAFRINNLRKDADAQRQADEEELQRVRNQNAEKQRLREEEGQLVIEGLQNIQGIADAFYQIGSTRRQKELEDLAHKKDQELQVAGDNAELKAQIEDNYRKRDLALRQKQAKADKAAALFNVALNTAMAVTSVLSTGGGTRYADFGISAGILSALVIAQGVAQAAVIAAKPIPQYFKGRENGPAEWAWVGDRGRELIEGKSGGMRLVEKPTVTYLQAGDKVHTAPRTEQILRNNRALQDQLLQRRYLTTMQGQVADMRSATSGPSASVVAVAQAAAQASSRDADRIITALHERPEWRLTEDGLRLYTRKGGTVTRHENAYYRRNG
ncbi:phage tail tape measure protein [Hymenobacter algoricola]|uniref:Phage tail tape measure protein domain-containing protein n=1 Tax=Hymenobacter algoricola TaxID=486267 RepID=A0ABP7N989_9BACT